MGRYTNEPILMSIANHLQIDVSPGDGGGGTMNTGEGFNIPGIALSSEIKMEQTNSSNIMTHSPGRQIKYIAIHYTAGGNSRPGHAAHMPSQWEQRAIEKPNNKGSADFGVDDGGMYQFNPDPSNWVCWAVGGPAQGNGGMSYRGRANNSNSVSIELCSTLRPGTSSSKPNHEGWSYTDAVIANGLKLTRFLMKKYNVPRENVIRHYDVSGKLCPGIIGWNDGPIYDTSGNLTGGTSNSSQWQKFKNSL